MPRYIDLEEFAKRITENIKPDAPEEKELIEWCKDECIRQGYAMPTADVAPKSEVACAIIDEIMNDIIDGLQGEIDAEEKQEENAWNESDTVGYHIHLYAYEKLDTLKTALSIMRTLLKKKYTGVSDNDY